jgi:hypothetical protein
VFFDLLLQVTFFAQAKFVHLLAAHPTLLQNLVQIPNGLNQNAAERNDEVEQSNVNQAEPHEVLTKRSDEVRETE